MIILYQIKANYTILHIDLYQNLRRNVYFSFMIKNKRIHI